MKKKRVLNEIWNRHYLLYIHCWWKLKWLDSLFELFYFTFFFSLSFIIFALYNEEIPKVTKKKKDKGKKKHCIFSHEVMNAHITNTSIYVI